MRNVTVAVVQMQCAKEVEANIAKADAMVREAAAKGAKIILLPELFERPYFCQERQYEYYAYATPTAQNPAVQHFRAVAKELGVVLPISDKYNDYAKQVADALNAKDVRVEVDYRGEKIGKKIRDAEVQKIPFMIVVGEKEQADGTISVRRHTQGDLGQMTVEALAAAVNDEVSHSIKQFK